MNAVSDVIQNRPRPLREFDQIYMKAGDMVMQSEFVARWTDGKRLVFVGDGDAISVCVSYLKSREVLEYGPSKVMVLDFDERIVNAVKRFADKERLENLDARLYNVLDALPDDLVDFDCFYTNPPWGQYNNGLSINLFVDRGMEAVSLSGEGLVVIADDRELPWPQEVLAQVQRHAAESGFYVARMQPELHLYHLDDAPDLRSCNLLFRSRPGNSTERVSKPVTDKLRLENFYGRTKAPKVRYIRELKSLNYGQAHDTEYKLELLEGLHERDS
nr:bis-aminopropyl spermidine synthase family protein [Oceanicola sp. 22II-s10i]